VAPLSRSSGSQSTPLTSAAPQVAAAGESAASEAPTRAVGSSVHTIDGAPPGVATPRAGPAAPALEPARLAEAQPNEVLHQVHSAIEQAAESAPTQVRLRLQPESLGGIELHIARHADGLHVSLQAESGSTARLLDSHLNDLRTSLADAGIQLAGLNVGHGQPQAHHGAPQGQAGARAGNPAGHEPALPPAEVMTQGGPAPNSYSATAIDYRI
jgi:flagellar hook-length control protein FliK